MNSYVYPIIILALLATTGYFYGRKKNKWIAGWISRETEDVLKPSETEYVNIGGTIGYNFTYRLKGAFRKASGSIIMLPRQSVFYYPISLLTTRFDRFYLNIKAEGRLEGEGHIVSGQYIRSARNLITDFASFNSEIYESKGHTFYILWKKQGLDSRLRQFIDSLESSLYLRHFCCHAENRNFFFLVKPVRGRLAEILMSATGALPFLYARGQESNE